ncbi:MAG: hypothetical protein QXF36_02525 [Candidatus Caldarchaeum sp.]
MFTSQPFSPSITRQTAMKIALDVDGVLADLAGMIIRLYEEDTGHRISRDMITEWEFWVKLSMTRQEFIDLITRSWRRWTELQPIEDDVAEDVEQLNKVGDVDILTQRPAETVEYVKQWLKQHGIKYRRFMWVPLKASKTSFIYDVYIDDSPHLAEKLANTRRTVFLYDQNWNRRVKPAPNIRRISSLDEAYQLLTCGDGFEQGSV